jgi:ABC-type phosphate/phosphonate transport system substrate-binding protein
MRAASLGMYDPPWLAAANDALWDNIAAALRAAGIADVPSRLDRARTLDEIWTDPALLLAQTCGWPLTTRLAGRVTYVATPRYALPGCEGATHRSFLVVRADDPARDVADLRGRTLALNGWDSNTGMNLPRALIAPLARDGRFFGRIVETGAHRASLSAVSERRADMASIDCVTHGLCARHRPEELTGLRVLAPTAPSPALPFVTRAGASAGEIATLRTALAAAARSDVARTVALAGIDVLPPDAYALLPAMAAEAARRGYPDLG